MFDLFAATPLALSSVLNYSVYMNPYESKRQTIIIYQTLETCKKVDNVLIPSPLFISFIPQKQQQQILLEPKPMLYAPLSAAQKIQSY